MEANDFERLGMAAVIGTALGTGLLMRVAAGNCTRAELSRELGLDQRALGLLLDVLAVEGFVRGGEGDHVAAGPAIDALSRTPGGLKLSLGLWAHLQTFMRSGEPFVKMDLAPPEREAVYRNVVSGLGEMFEQPARSLAERLPLAPREVLDVGCGSGVWSLAIGSRHPEARITGLDLPAVLDNFVSRATASGLSSRTATIPGNMHDVAVPHKAFDLVVIANVLRLEPAASAASLVRRMAGALRDDGAMLVIDALAHGTPARERARALYALHLALRTQSGGVHAPADITRWLAEAGLERVELIDIDESIGAVGALLGKKA